jgi:hypothetical protein
MEKLILVPVKVEWQAGRYGIRIEAVEQDVLNISIVVTFLNGDDKEIVITFKSFAEIKYVNLNFGESRYNDFIIKSPSGELVDNQFDWDKIKTSGILEKNKTCYNPYFYSVENTLWWSEKEEYVKLKAKGFEHFILVGYDSYIEIFGKNDFEWALAVS